MVVVWSYWVLRAVERMARLAAYDAHASQATVALLRNQMNKRLAAEHVRANTYEPARRMLQRHEGANYDAMVDRLVDSLARSVGK